MFGAFSRRVARARIRLHVGRGGRLRRNARYGDAERELRCALELAETTFEPQAGELIGPLNEIALLYKYAGRFDEAEALYRRALTLAEKAGNDGTVATINHNLGGLNHARASYEEAEPFARAAVAARTRLLGVEHPDVAADEAALGAILDAEDKTEEAKEIFRRCLDTFERELGPNHYEVGATLNNLGALLARRGETAAAEPMYRRALAIKQRCLSKDHPEVAIILNNLAVLKHKQGWEADALRLADRAVRIVSGSLPPAHPTRRACEENHHKFASGQHGSAFPKGG